MNMREMTTQRFFISRLTFVVFVLLALALSVSGQEQQFKIDYRLAMPQPHSHLFEVTMEVEVPADNKTESLDFQMAKWSPGRYAVFDFAKNVQEVVVLAGKQPPPGGMYQLSVPVNRVNDQTWRVQTLGNTRVTFTYKVFANDLSGTFSQLDSRHANYNGGSIFMYVVNHKQDPVTLTINPPAGWRIVNGRMEKRDQREWRFANWDIMIDTPTEIAPDWTQDSFTVEGKQYHVVLHAFGKLGNRRAALVRDIEKIVRAEVAMWGPPDFDSYTFLIHFANDGHSGDGMEHLTSTQIIQPGELADPRQYEDALVTAAHEFFHVWNVKRLRPSSWGPGILRARSTRAVCGSRKGSPTTTVT
jgi:predicted metalloprotease with PDZ domain